MKSNVKWRRSKNTKKDKELFQISKKGTLKFLKELNEIPSDDLLKDSIVHTCEHCWSEIEITPKMNQYIQRIGAKCPVCGKRLPDYETIHYYTS